MLTVHAMAKFSFGTWETKRIPPPPFETKIPIGTIQQAPIILRQFAMSRVNQRAMHRVGTSINVTIVLAAGSAEENEGRTDLPSHAIQIQATDCASFVLAQRLLQGELARIRTTNGIQPPLMLPPLSSSRSAR